jgi:hypothetical protein
MRTTLISAVAVALVCGWQVFAQTSAGVKGVVTDSSGALVPGAEVVVTNLGTGARRQTLTNETGVYEVPVGKGRTFLAAAPRTLDYVLGGWTLGWVFAAQSGTPVGLNQSYNYTCKSFAPPNGTSVAHWFNPQAGFTGNPNTCASQVPHIGGTGFTYNTTAGQTPQVRNPTVPNLDLSLEKRFRVTERVSFELRGEAFNALNSVLLLGPDTNPADGPASLFYNTTTKHSYWQGFGTVGDLLMNVRR